MSKWATINDWLVNEESNGGVDVLASALDPSAGGGSGEPPRDSQQPGREGEGAPAPPLEKRNLKNPMEQPAFPDPDASQPPSMAEPVAPDMPDEKDQKQETANFELWTNKFFKDSVKGDVNDLLDSCMSVRNKDLDAYPRKFV